MLPLIRERLPEVLRAVAPLFAIVIALQVALVHAGTGLVVQFVAGSLLAVAGMVLLFAGIDMGILPMGRFIGAALPRKGSLALILSVAFAMGFATTAAEPDVLVLTSQVAAASAGAVSGTLLVYVIASGVGVFTALALYRVIRGFSMLALLGVSYGVMLVLSLLAPTRFVPLAYDAGSVTTGVLTAPVVLALALGFNSVLAGRSTIENGFGLLGLASIGPIIVVLALGMLL